MESSFWQQIQHFLIERMSLNDGERGVQGNPFFLSLLTNEKPRWESENLVLDFQRPLGKEGKLRLVFLFSIARHFHSPVAMVFMTPPRYRRRLALM